MEEKERVCLQYEIWCNKEEADKVTKKVDGFLDTVANVTYDLQNIVDHQKPV